MQTACLVLEISLSKPIFSDILPKSMSEEFANLLKFRQLFQDQESNSSKSYSF